MPVFRYALQTALERLAESERAAKRSFSERRIALAYARAALEALERETETTRNGLARPGASRAEVFAEIDRRLAALQSRHGREAERIAVAARDFAQARAELETAMRRHSALARHRERKYAAYLQACDLREAAEFDESNALAAGRSTRFA